MHTIPTLQPSHRSIKTLSKSSLVYTITQVAVKKKPFVKILSFAYIHLSNQKKIEPYYSLPIVTVFYIALQPLRLPF